MTDETLPPISLCEQHLAEERAVTAITPHTSTELNRQPGSLKV
jgi:hypothetical protein